MKSIKLTDYYEIMNPKYVFLKVTPDTSIRNYSSANIARIINHMNRSIWNHIRRVEKKFIFETPTKIGFFTDIKVSGVDFYFIVSQRYMSLVTEKITETWNKVTIQVVESIPQFSDEALKYQLKYSKEDAFSLATDKKCNEPLNSILNVLEIMQENDRVGILYNFMPSSQRGWSKKYERSIARMKNNQPLEKEILSAPFILKYALIIAKDILLGMIEGFMDFLGKPKPVELEGLIESAVTSLVVVEKKKLSSATVSKKDSAIISTQMIVLSDSKDKLRKENNAVAVLESYKTISEDNELVYKKLKSKSLNIEDYRIRDAEENLLSIDECQNLLELPGRTLLEQHKCIEKVDVLESIIPEELRQGTMCIGESIYKGNKQNAYLSTDKEFKNLTVCLVGPTRAGKTTLISNLSKDGVDNSECTILFDFCGNCELSDEVSSIFQTDKVLNIDCSNFNKLQGFGYNEISPANDTPFEVYRCAKTQASQLITLINSINADDNELKSRMERFLGAASAIVFINNGPIKDVFEVLQNHSIRKKYINTVPSEQIENLKENIEALEELDEIKEFKDKDTKQTWTEVVGTKISNVTGILNRVHKLKQNAYMELMLKKDCSKNINLIDEMQKPQLICIRMPEVMFSTEMEKDIYCTYWLTKIWGALQKRKWDYPKEEGRVKVNIVFDELYQIPSCQEFLRSKLSQIAKFNAKPIISCHYLGQIGTIRDELKAANSSYMLISGCDKDNYKELKDELYPYTLEDLLNLKRYHSLNLIKYEKGYAKFITKLPPPIK